MWHWRFRWALACLLPTLLRIHHEGSRVQCVGLRRNDLGGVFLVAPSTLCGFPTVMQGSAGVSASQVVRCPVIPAGPEPYARGFQVGLADIAGKVCQGHTVTVGLYASGGSPCRSSTQRYILRADLPLIAPFRSMLLTARGGSCSLAPKVHEVPVYRMASLHSYIPLARHTHSSVLVRHPNSGGHIIPTILPRSLCWLRKRPSISATRSSGSPRASRACWRASAARCARRRSRARCSCAVRRRRCLAFACFLTDRVIGDMVYSWLQWGAVAVAGRPSTRARCPRTSVSTVSLLRHALCVLAAFFCHPSAVYIHPRQPYQFPHR